jgi:hypothetical protein
VPAVLLARLHAPREGVSAAEGRVEVHPAEGQAEAKRADPVPARFAAAQAPHGPGRREAGSGKRWQDWDLVWCEPNGRPIDPHDDWEEWKALLAEAGIIKDARLHDARHTSGTLLGEQHVDLHVIQRILGHAQVSTTRIYTDPRTR